MKIEEIVMYESDDAAKQVTVTGWASRHGRFFGHDERSARYDGCTHRICDCGKPAPKSYIHCDECREKNDDERYLAMPYEEWNGTDGLYSRTADRYFFDSDEVYTHCDTNECTVDSLQLVICIPHYASEIEPNEHYCDDLPEDGEVDGELKEAFEELNKRIRAYRVPLSWWPGKVRTTLPETEAPTVEATDKT